MMKVYFTCDWFADGERALNVLSRLRKTTGLIRILTGIWDLQRSQDKENPQSPGESETVWYSSREIIYEEDYISFCEGKASLGEQMADADLFLFLVGTGPGGSDTGSCRACGNYNVWSGMCGLGKSCDDRGFADFECSLAKKLEIKTVVLYQGDRINRELCPKQLKDAGVHLCERDLFPEDFTQNREN